MTTQETNNQAFIIANGKAWIARNQWENVASLIGSASTKSLKLRKLSIEADAEADRLYKISQTN